VASKTNEKWSLHSFLTTVPQQANVAGSILLFFYKKKTKQNKKVIKYEKWSLHSFLTTTPQQADVADNILLFFYKKKRKQNKKNNKILQATSACCGAVVRNECRDHFSI
jgi:hypothetical protein